MSEESRDAAVRHFGLCRRLACVAFDSPARRCPAETVAVRRPKDLFPILDRSKSLFAAVGRAHVFAGDCGARVGVDRRARCAVAAQESRAVDRFERVSTSSTPAAFRKTDLKWQPPLGSWVAAGAVHLPGPIGAHGLELVDYLSAASLVPASFFLAYRLFGRRIGFVTALLVALAHHVSRAASKCHAARPGHPDGDGRVLGISRPFAARGRPGVARSVGGRDFAGPVSARGGAAGLRRGGGVARARVGKFRTGGRVAASRRPRGGSTSGPGWPAFRSLGVLVATAFAAGGWWELMMLYSYGGEFLTAGCGACRLRRVRRPRRSPFFRRPSPCDSLQEFFAMARVLAGLTLLGLWTIGRGLCSGPAARRRASFLFLAGWFVWALVFFAAGLRDAAPGSLVLEHVAAVSDVGLHGLLGTGPRRSGPAADRLAALRDRDAGGARGRLLFPASQPRGGGTAVVGAGRRVGVCRARRAGAAPRVPRRAKRGSGWCSPD